MHLTECVTPLPCTTTMGVIFLANLGSLIAFRRTPGSVVGASTLAVGVSATTFGIYNDGNTIYNTDNGTVVVSSIPWASRRTLRLPR